VSPRPFAEYHLVASRPDLEIDFHDGRSFAVLDGRVFDVGRTPEAAVTVRFSNPPAFRSWGGRRNHRLSWSPERGWEIAHLGHSGVIFVDEQRFNGRPHALPLRHGSRVVPTEELVFEFRLRPDLESLWNELVGERLPPGAKLEVLHDALLERGQLDAAGVAVALEHFRARATPG
jgi:hypothetical protein